MHFGLFKPGEDKNSTPSSKEKKPETVAVLGKFYSFQAEDKPVLCTIPLPPLEKANHTYFSLSYEEANEPYQAVRLFVKIDNKETVLLSLRAIKDTRLAIFFEKLEQKAQTIGITSQIKSTDLTYLYAYKGNPEKIKQLFPILKDLLMNDRYCADTKDHPLTALFAYFEKLYATIEQNFLAQQPSQSSPKRYSSFST